MRKLTICGVNIAEFTVVLNAIPHPAEKRAAEFLRNTIKASCGIELPISDQAEHGIYIGTRQPCDCVKWDGFRITTDERNLYLDGNMARGTLYAAYDFAEKYLGYRYFADDCIRISTEGDADVPCGLKIVENPGFSSRRTTCYQHVTSAEMSAHSRINDCVPVDETYGGVSPANGECHTFYRLCPSELYFDEHPEYFSYVIDEKTGEGKRIPCSNDYANGGQLCLTNPDVIRIVAENVKKDLREHPEKKFAEVSQCDNRHFCQCERCAAVDAEEGSNAGTMIRFVNAVAEEVEKEFPDVMIRTFAYQYTRIPPKITKARHNVLIRYCTIEACFRHSLNDPNCPSNASKFLPELSAWGKMAEQISIWDYITNWACFNAPFPNLLSLRENARFFADNHAIHILEECNSGSPNGGLAPQMKAYLIGKLLWNPYMSEEEYEGHICEFLRAYYGKGWREIAHVIKLDHETTANRCIGCFDDADWGRYSPDIARPDYTPLAYQPTFEDHRLVEFIKHMDEAKACYDRAYALAETEEERRHIEMSRFAVSYTDLFLTPHHKDQMTEEEQKAYEAEVEKLYADKERFGMNYNIETATKGR